MPQSSASGESPRSNATRHNRDGGKLSAASGGESEAEHWAVPQSSASGESPRSSATRHNRVESLKEHFPLRGGFMLRLMACIHLAGTLGHRFSEKSQFSSFSTRRGVRCVKNARNPQRIPALFALRPLTPCEKVEHFFVFRNALKTAAGGFFLTPSTESAPKMYLAARTPSAH